MTPDEQLPDDERLRLLEAHVQVQEQVLAAMQAERIEAERLNESVARLGMGASDLGAALLQVDKNQQMMTKLGQDITRVEREAASSVEVEAKVAEAKAEAQRKLAAARKQAERELQRARRQRNMIIAAVATLAVIGSIAALLLNRQQAQSDYEACVRSQGTVFGVNTFLTAVAKNSQNEEIRSTASDLVARFEVPVCEEP